MSATEYQQGEQRSSVKISTTAAGKPLVEVKAYSHDLALLDEAREKAVSIYKQTVTDVTS